MVPIARCAWSAQKAEESFWLSDDGRLREVLPASGTVEGAICPTSENPRVARRSSWIAAQSPNTEFHRGRGNVTHALSQCHTIRVYTRRQHGGARARCFFNKGTEKIRVRVQLRPE